MLYCKDDNTERALEIGKEQESIISVNEKTKKDLKFYEGMLRDGRKHQEYWDKLKDQIKLKRKERTEISKLLDVELNDLDKAIKDNNIEYFRGLRHSAKGMIGDSKYDSQSVIDWRKDF